MNLMALQNEPRQRKSEENVGTSTTFLRRWVCATFGYATAKRCSVDVCWKEHPNPSNAGLISQHNCFLFVDKKWV